ncbi:MAG: flagellar basal body-associated protein FliL [Rhodomicrobium sp.]
MAEGGSSRGATLGLIIGTLAAVGGGFAFGALLLKMPEPGVVATATAKKVKQPDKQVIALAPIVTNLGDPSSLFVRVEAAIVLEPDTPESAALTARIGDDIVAYLRTVSITEIQGPTGYQFLKEDLKKRAIQLGGGKIRDFLVTSFVIE